MITFSDMLNDYSWQKIQQSIYRKTTEEVISALQKRKRNLEDFKALISPAAKSFVEEMAQQSRKITQKHFGNTIRLYAPMYLSNECYNICTYCGFSYTNKIPRRTLTEEEILTEAAFLKNKGYQHILLVTGEDGRRVGVSYLEKAIKLLRPHFVNISIEVQPLQQEDYERLIAAGLYAVMVYQETYHEIEYKKHHLKGRKRNFQYRLETPDRLGRAGIHKIGLGALFGLEDWRTDSFFTALHLNYLQKKYWKTHYSISFPQLRPYEGGLQLKSTMDDTDLVQLICAYRMLSEDIELSISTRESTVFRDHIVKIGATTLSAESRTNPGGYVVDRQSLEQFSTHDKRTTEEIAAMLKAQGLEVVWKDWEYFVS